MTIKVKYDVFTTRYFIDKALDDIFQNTVLSFDTETRGVYTAEERAEAAKLLKQDDLPVDTKRLALLVADNSGLSFPALVQVTHFVFGSSEDYSIILICQNPQTEMYIWKRIADYSGLLLIHNTLYDLKIMYDRIKKLPKNYEDTALLSKCLINNVATWKAKVGLKELMGEYYDPAWSVFNEYEPEHLRDPKFLMYAATDGGATFKLWEMLMEHLDEENFND